MGIHRGVTRTVVVAGGWAVKFPSLRGGWGGARTWLWSLTSGIQANLSEVEWSAHPAACPVSWSLLGIVNVYRRAEPVPSGIPIDYATVGAPFGDWPPLNVDPKRENVGVIGGRLVWIDYDQSAADCMACRRYRLG